MSQDSSADADFFAEIARVLDDVPDTGTHFYSLGQPITPALRGAMTAWLRTLPSGLGEAELEARARAWYAASEWSEGESGPGAG